MDQFLIAKNRTFTYPFISKKYMLLVITLYILIFSQLLRSIWEEGNLVYKDPKFWLQLFSIFIVAYVYIGI